MQTVFIADAHLVRPGDENYRLLLEFLDGLPGIAERLVILGDLFAFWAGFRSGDYPPYRPLLDTLERLHGRGVEIVFVEGNHDFHLEPYLGRVLGWKILPDGGLLEIDGRRLFVAHGDLVNPDDLPYLRLRRIFRSGWFRTLCGAIPPALMKHIANLAMRESGRRRPPTPPGEKMIGLLERYAAKMFATGADAVVVGHLHAPLHHRTDRGEILVVGDWISQYSYAVLEQGRLSLHAYRQSPADRA